MGEFVSALGNPWLPQEWNLTRQGEFFKRYGARRAEQFKDAALRVAAEQQLAKPVHKTFVIIKKVGNTQSGGGGGGGLIGAGSSGEGPPV